MKPLFWLSFLVAPVLFFLSCSDRPELSTGERPVATATPPFALTYRYRVVQTYPHDPGAFTQGLVLDNGRLYESTGLQGQSTLREIELVTGKVLRRHDLSARFFGEGLTVYQGRIIQLTLKSNVGFVYDKNTFELLQTFSYPTEGWGITHDGQRLIMSDGTSTLRFLDPEIFAENGRIEVYDDNGPVARLNELEYIRGEIYANVWPTNYIVRIAPDTGQVLGRVDFTGLLDPSSITHQVDVFNGIAYDPENDRLFVTGKFWPYLFEVKLTKE